MTTPKETWKQVPKYFGKYQVSDLGRVKDYTGRIMKDYAHPRGYRTITFTFNKKPKTVTIHRLVASLFLDNPDEKPQINHLNGIKTDNRATNLEWCTAQENIEHAMENGLYKKVQRRYTPSISKLKPDDVLYIRDMYERNIMNVSELSDRFNISSVAVYKVINKVSYAYI